jgi:uncharacterized protein (DUF433 family)
LTTVVAYPPEGLPGVIVLRPARQSKPLVLELVERVVLPFLDNVPCIRNLRIPVGTVLGKLAAGMTEAEILDDHPDLEPEDIRAALQYAAEAARERILPLDPVT